MKEVRIRVRDIIIVGLILILVFYFTFEIFKIKHQMKFAALVNQVNQNTVWIQNFSQSIQQAQQKALEQQGSVEKK